MIKEGQSRRWNVLSIVLLSIACLVACKTTDASDATKKADKPAPVEPQGPVPVDAATPDEPKPAPPKPAPTNAADLWLEKIEARAAKIKTLEGSLVYKRIQGLKGDEQIRSGSVIYIAGPPAKFAVHFERLAVPVGRQMKVQEQNRLYIFDGTWFVEKLDDKKIFNKRQIAPPPKEGEQRANPLADGTGPFVLPLNLKKKDIKSRFTVKVIKTSKRDPENSIHLRLTPRPPRRIDFEQIDLWYSKKSLLPLRVETVDDAENESVINISKHKVNGEIDLKKVDVKEPKERGWKITVTPWEEK